MEKPHNKTLYSYAVSNFEVARVGIGSYIAQLQGKSSPDLMYKQLLDLAVAILEDASSLKEDTGNAIDKFYKTTICYVDLNIMENRLNGGADANLILQIKFMLSAVASTVNILPGLICYTPEELQKLVEINGEAKYRDIRFFYTLGQAITGQDTRKYAATVLPIIRKNIRRENYEWEEAYCMFLMLYTCWAVFRQLQYDDQALLMENYFYSSIAAGIPLRAILSEYLTDSVDTMDFILKTGVVTELLEANSELIDLDVQSASFSALVVAYISFVGNSGSSERALFSYLENYSLEGSAKKILAEAIDVAYRIIKFTLVPIVEYHRDGYADQYLNELVGLIRCFIYKPWWPFFVTYYNKKEQRVPLRIVLENIFKNEDLNDSVRIEKIIEFKNFLHQNKLLPADQDIIFFSESDGKFHWNPPSLESYGGQVPLRSSADRQKQRNIE